jgi:hypothetical protein
MQKALKMAGAFVDTLATKPAVFGIDDVLGMRAFGDSARLCIRTSQAPVVIEMRRQGDHWRVTRVPSLELAMYEGFLRHFSD